MLKSAHAPTAIEAHSCLQDLMPNETVYYRVGNSQAMSQVFQFRSLNDAGTTLVCSHGQCVLS